MYFLISHTLFYQYDHPVKLNPFTIRLRPRHDCTQELLKFHYHVQPDPSLITQNIDHDSHSSIVTFFEGLHTALQVTIQSEVNTLRANPFDFLPFFEHSTIPFEYPAPMQHMLSPYIKRQYHGSTLQELANNFLHQTNFQIIPFLCHLSDYIYHEFTYCIRPTGAPLSPSELLEHKQGTCRDFSVLFMEICRSVGLASRFVSGYSEENPDLNTPQQEMHAWAEVYIPGGGWRGFDPSLGLAVADQHVVVATGASPLDAAPTSGSYLGANPDHHFSYKLDISTAQINKPPLENIDYNNTSLAYLSNS